MDGQMDKGGNVAGKAPSRPRRAASRNAEPLHRNRVAEAAIEIMDQSGIEAVSMRIVAERLGVTPMALYNHVSSKRDLLRAIAERILTDARFDHGLSGWRVQVEACFRSLRAVCLRHPGLPRLLEIEGVAPAAVFAPLEVTLAALAEAGLDPGDALRAFYVLLSFTLAQSSYQSRGSIPDIDPAEAIRAGRLEGRNASTVEAAVPSGDWDFDRAFDFGLKLILDGIAVARQEGGGSSTSGKRSS
jgi:AcrR family transcriptional regulator